MAETVVINIEANTQGLQSTIDLLVKLGKVEKSVADDFKKSNEQNVNALNSNVQKTVKSFEQIDKALKGIKNNNTLASALDATAPLAKTGNSVQSMKSRLKEAVAEAQMLAEKFGDLDPRAIAAAKSAAQLKDQIDDTNKRINALNPENKFNAIKNLGGAIGGVFQVATGSLQAFGVESEQATKIAQQFQGALNIFQGLQQLGQFKDALVEVKAALGITSVATGVQATATEGLAVAEGEATVASNALNASILANPYVLAAAALVALVAAIVVFTNSNDEAEKAQRKLNDAIEGSKAEYEGINNFLNRQAKQRISDVQTELDIATAQGKSAKELGEIKKKLNDEQLRAINKQIELNNKKNEEDANSLEELFKLNTEESVKQFKQLEQDIEDRKKANKDLLADAYLIKNQRKVLEAEITNDITEENKKRQEAAKQATEKLNEEEIGKRLFEIKKRYNDERAEASKLTNDKEILAIKETEIALRENAEQLALYKEGSKEYQALILERQKLAGEQELQLKPIPLRFEVPEKIIPEKEVKPVDVKIEPDIEFIRLKEAKAKIKDIFNEIGDVLKNLGFDLLQQQFEDQIQGINDAKDAQLQAIDEEQTALQESYDKRRIGKRELEENQKKLALDRVNAEKKAEKELNEVRKKQDIAKKAQAIFDIAISTAKAVMAISADMTVPILVKPGLIAATIALGAVQAAAVLAQPLPKYKKGTLSVGGVGSDDSQLALLQPGEAVIPTETNRKYQPAIKAIYEGSIKPSDINEFVKMRLKGGYSIDNRQSLTAKMEVSDLYALSRIMKKNDGVVVKNLGELAILMSNSYNPRR